MDVILPDGQVINGVPEGTTKTQLAQKLQSNGFKVPSDWLAPAQPPISDQELSDFRAQGFKGTKEELATQKAQFDEQKGQHSALLQAARDVPVGLTSGLTGLADLATMGPRAIRKGEEAIARKLGANIPDSGPWFPSTNAVAAPLDQALAMQANTPQTAGQRLMRDVTRGVSGAAATAGVGAAASIPFMAAKPGLQLLSGGSGALASGATREAGGGPMAQFAAGIAGSLAPPLATAGSQALVRQIARGSNPAQMQQNIQDFADVGTTPSVGQATQNRRMQATESYLTKAPGGAGPMTAKAAQQAQEVQAELENQAASLAPKTTGQKTGAAIEKGISGPGGFIEGFKAKQSQLYNRLDQYVPKDSPVKVGNTLAALDKLNADIPEAEALSEFLKQPQIVGIQGALEKDLAGTPATTSPILQSSGQPFINPAGPSKTTMPYDAIKQIRTQIGNKLADAPLVSDVPRAAYKQLYGALSSDMEAAAKSQGPQATAAWNRANLFTKAGMNRIDQLQNVVDKAGGPEKIFSAATSGTKEGATTLAAVMKSLPQDAQKQVSATIIRRLGMATAGAQNDVGDVFSTERFLTNWNNLSPEAKSVLFNRFGPNLANSMDKVAKFAANLRAGSQVFRNSSGTGQAAMLGGTVGGAAMAALTGHPGIAAGVGGGVLANNGAARLMTNPRFVNWLAMSTNAPMESLPALTNQLAQSAAHADDQDAADFALRLRFQAKQ